LVCGVVCVVAVCGVWQVCVWWCGARCRVLCSACVWGRACGVWCGVAASVCVGERGKRVVKAANMAITPRARGPDSTPVRPSYAYLSPHPPTASDHSKWPTILLIVRVTIRLIVRHHTISASAFGTTGTAHIRTHIIIGNRQIGHHRQRMSGQ